MSWTIGLRTAGRADVRPRWTPPAPRPGPRWSLGTTAAAGCCHPPIGATDGHGHTLRTGGSGHAIRRQGEGEAGWSFRRLGIRQNAAQTLTSEGISDFPLCLRPYPALAPQPIDEAAIARQQDADPMLREAGFIPELFDFGEETM